ncbi:putative ABC transporter permease protein YclO [Kurthia zopfii]|uniref:Iron complex transport system permease protein n=1 Tax=Kurthia zopfii TaxID=1650 RepID=A0A2U3AFJ1_9BACL|nr:iron chelate uptake ABC transporter family permease subunit [Kurthia zopfii]PWI23290.1 iron ABC transporter permease [Kurthia zopfii]TDR42153.1 iron complex transport system permease protein [Kurthia zopfii]STX10928.1 Iron-uptake system permease protein FeuC [Kurthia zopfii]VEI05700.1 Iron-uptake system permease protein FeuC [Kurthia zopfii]GEK29910.1 putative ABC transporter permease protein YclO [Kurthia zopfii]
MRSNKTKLLIMLALVVVATLLYVFQDLNGSYHYALPRRLMKVLAMAITGIAIAYATVTFQTITHNRILTPSIMGIDSMYMLLQTLIIFTLGSAHIAAANSTVNFFISLVGMVGFALILYRFMFRKEGQPIFFLLLVGIIVGTLLGSLTTFLQVLIDPNEFMNVQDKMFASFNNVDVSLVWIALVIVVVTIAYGWTKMSELDVLSLGRDNARNLGVNYDGVVKTMLILSAILIATSTALVGPITFFGLIVANLAYQFFHTYKHSVLVTGAMLFSMIALIGGQWIVERVFTFSTTLSVIINFVGGIYFIYLLLRESRSS